MRKRTKVTIVFTDEIQVNKENFSEEGLDTENIKKQLIDILQNKSGFVSEVRDYELDEDEFGYTKNIKINL